MDPTVASFSVAGLCAAPFQPFTDIGDVDYESISAHVEELVRQGVKYAFVAGTTGEGVTMSVAERKSVLEKWIAASSGRIGIIAHVGSEALADVKELTTHAASAGAVAISAMPTSFFKPDGLDAIVSYFETIAACAPHLPLYYYHLAIKTGVYIRCDKLLAKIGALQVNEGRLKSFRGIKYSDADLHIYSNCASYRNPANGQAFDCLYGKDEQLLGALAMGCKGAVGSTYNYMGRVYLNLIAAFNKGDMTTALAEMRKAQEIVNMLYSASDYGHSAANVGKAMMELRLGGKHCGPPRQPGVAVPAGAGGMDKLRADLDKLGFFGW